MTKQFLERKALLANGDTVPLVAAANAFARLGSHLQDPDPDSEWDVVYFLRELALGRGIEPEQRRALMRELLLDQNGDLEPHVRSVVLSAVRGEGRLLHMDSPFTNSDDRAIAEFLNSQTYVQGLEPDESEEILSFGLDLDKQLRDVMKNQPTPPALRKILDKRDHRPPDDRDGGSPESPPNHRSR